MGNKEISNWILDATRMSVTVNADYDTYDLEDIRICLTQQ